jgi:hypothetical protein
MLLAARREQRRSAAPPCTAGGAAMQRAVRASCQRYGLITTSCAVRSSWAVQGTRVWAMEALWGAVTPITPAVHHPHACAAPSEPRKRLTPSAAQRVGACVDTRAVLAVQTKKYTTHLKWTREHFRVWTCMETGLFSAMAPSHTSYGLAHAPAPTHSSMHAVQARAKPSAARPSCGQPRQPRAIRPRAPHPGRRRAWLK